MKSFLLFLVGAILGIAGYQYYQRTQHPTVAQRAQDAADTTRDKAGELKDKVVAGTRTVGEKVDDARIIAAIKGKYVLDKDLSALAISVSCRDGYVSLTGSAATPELVSRAARLARETSGVTGVNSELTVRP